MFGKARRVDPKLEEALRKAAATPMTPADIDAQRRAYVRGEMGIGSDRDEAEMAQAVASGNAERVAELEAASEARAAAADAFYEERMRP